MLLERGTNPFVVRTGLKEHAYSKDCQCAGVSNLHFYLWHTDLGTHGMVCVCVCGGGGGVDTSTNFWTKCIFNKTQKL